MHLTYNTTVEDIRAFAGYLYSHSKTLRMYRLKSLAIYVVAIIAAYIVFFRSREPFVTLLIIGVAVLGLFATDIYTRRSYIRNAVRMYLEREKDRESRSSTLTITDSGIRAVSEDVHGELKWERIDRIEELEDRSYIFISPLDAFTIRRDAVTDGDYRTFIDTTKERLEQHRPESPQP